MSEEYIIFAIAIFSLLSLSTALIALLEARRNSSISYSQRQRRRYIEMIERMIQYRLRDMPPWMHEEFLIEVYKYIENGSPEPPDDDCDDEERRKAA